MILKISNWAFELIRDDEFQFVGFDESGKAQDENQNRENGLALSKLHPKFYDCWEKLCNACYAMGSHSIDPVLLSIGMDDPATTNVQKMVDWCRESGPLACMRFCPVAMLDSCAFRNGVPVPAKTEAARGDWFRLVQLIGWLPTVDLFESQAKKNKGVADV